MGSLFLAGLCLAGFCAWHFTCSWWKMVQALIRKISAADNSVRMLSTFDSPFSVAPIPTSNELHSHRCLLLIGHLSLNPPEPQTPPIVSILPSKSPERVASICSYHISIHSSWWLHNFHAIQRLTHWTIINFPMTPLHSQYTICLAFLRAQRCFNLLLPAPTIACFEPWLKYVLAKNNEHRYTLPYIQPSNRRFVSIRRCASQAQGRSLTLHSDKTSKMIDHCCFYIQLLG